MKKLDIKKISKWESELVVLKLCRYNISLKYALNIFLLSKQQKFLIKQHKNSKYFQLTFYCDLLVSETIFISETIY